MKKYIYFIISILSAGVLLGCEGFLDEKPNKSIVVPTSLDDLQALLDYDRLNHDLSLLLIGTDDFYTTDAGFLGYDPWQQRGYVWEKDLYDPDQVSVDWFVAYGGVFYSNTVLDQLEKGGYGNDGKAGHIRGAAHFYRAYAYYNLAQAFLPFFDRENPDKNITIPVRLSPDVSLEASRQSVGEVYDLIFEDLRKARDLLPETTSYLTRPTQGALDAFLARIYLAIEDYDQAGKYAYEAIGSSKGLMDYNNLDRSMAYPFRLFNDEVLFHSRIIASFNFTYSPLTYVDSILYDMYEEADLRKELFYTVNQGGINFSGGYTGNFNLFSGLAVNELYLILAETQARSGNSQAALETLNQLLEKRYIYGSFDPYTVANVDDVLGLILQERRKELAFRGVRWSDLKRLSRDPARSVTITRTVNGQSYQLEPNPSSYYFNNPSRELTFE